MSFLRLSECVNYNLRARNTTWCSTHYVRVSFILILFIELFILTFSVVKTQKLFSFSRITKCECAMVTAGSNMTCLAGARCHVTYLPPTQSLLHTLYFKPLTTTAAARSVGDAVLHHWFMSLQLKQVGVGRPVTCQTTTTARHLSLRVAGNVNIEITKEYVL